MEVKGNSDFIWKDSYFQELKEELLPPWSTGYGSVISLQGNQGPASHEAAKKETWGKQGQTVNNYYTLVVEAQRLVVYIDVCACLDVFILFYINFSHYWKRQKR